MAPESPTRTSRPELGIVVIARNEAENIGRTLEAALAAAENHANTSVVLIDSDSTDETVAIASRYPIDVYRYSGPIRSAAAGRRLGGERVDVANVLFIDGDCTLMPDWLPGALALLQADPRNAAVYGLRRNVFKTGGADPIVRDSQPGEFGMGGNALYRKDVLQEVGGFNPYLGAEEESELEGRIRKRGYRVLDTRTLMFEHHTLPRESTGELLRRIRSGLHRGPGPVLRLAAQQGLLAHHARRYNRYLLMLAYLLGGALALVATLASGRAVVLVAWAATGILMLAVLAWKRGSLREASFIVLDWASVAISLLPGLLRTPRRPDAFAPPIEHVHAQATDSTRRRSGPARDPAGANEHE